MKNRLTFTVFTPTYNRAYSLPHVYESLVAQTFQNFEWLIVDDGSTDETREVVQRWVREGRIPIRYCYQENGGRHRAFNAGVRAAHGSFFLQLDSDDRCVPQALERLNNHWESIPGHLRERFSGVTGLCMKSNGEIIGSSFPENIVDSNSIEIRGLHGVTGEKWGFQRTDILVHYPYPEIEGEKYIASSYVWNRIGRKYLTRYVNDPLRVYELSKDSVTVGHLKTRIKNPKGASLFYNELSSMALNTVAKIRASINYVRFARHAHQNFYEIARKSKARSALPISFAMGYFFYVRDRIAT